MVCVRGRRGVREGSEEWRGAGWSAHHQWSTIHPRLSWNNRVDDKVGLAFPPHSVVSARAWAHGAAWVAHRFCCWKTSNKCVPAP